MPDETTSTPPAVGGDGDTKINAENPNETPIINPEAKYKAEAEKYQRLFEKATAELTTAQSLAQKLQDEQRQTVEKLISDAMAKIDAEKAQFIAQAEAEKLKAMRTRLVVASGLDADLAEFLTGTDEATIAEQVKKLAEKVKPKAPSLRSGNSLGGQSAGGKPSWMGTSSSFGGGGVISPDSD
jgi:hypothetical protein